MKLIALSKNQIVKVSEEDFLFLNHWEWMAYHVTSISSNNKIHHYGFKAGLRQHGRYIWMHNVIMNPQKGFEVDHINNDTLDNRRTNLRVVTHQENCLNRSKYKCKEEDHVTSKYIGVSFKFDHNRIKPWCASWSGKHLGYFETEEEAAHRRDAYVKENFGDLAKLNFVNN